jgi:leucyl aminopeptidase
MFKSISVGGNGHDALIIGHFQGEKPDDATLQKLAKIGAADAVLNALSRPDATGESGAIVEAFPDRQPAAPAAGAKAKKPVDPATIPSRVIIVGLGKPANFDVDSLRHIAGVVGRRLANARVQSAIVDFSGPIKARELDARHAGTSFGEGLGLLGWVCDQFRGGKKQDEEAKRRVPLAVRTDNARFQQGIERGLALAISTNFCRTLSQTPPNIATTQFITDEAKKLAKDCGLAFKEWAGEALEKERFTGLINVGKASENKPRLLRLEYRPDGGKKDAKPVVLVGKTMTYDTGGLSLKINNGMVGMKRDKDGGCAVIGAMHAIATVIKPKVPVVAYLAVAENSISDEAYRPDDVITYRNGVTVEVTNTDAEGRLVLADALVYACEKENPSCIVDLATLTGGVVVALGSTFCGMFCEDDTLRSRIEKAASAAGERVWRLPMHSEYRDMMKSPIADIQNSNAARKAHPIQGAAFLSYFVEDTIPWCHLDIAGVHVAEKNAGPYIEGPTGWGVRLLANFAESYPTRG